tara:strand:+ start:304 stop:507 length:204 start_codon:yes stop_codon:yes gene_type:complete
MSIEFNSEGTSTDGDTVEAPSRLGVNEKIDYDMMIFMLRWRTPYYLLIQFSIASCVSPDVEVLTLGI